MGFGRDRARQSFEGTLSEAHADNAMPSFFRMNWRMTHVTGSAIEAKAAFSAPGNLSAHDDYDESSIAHRLTAAANMLLALLLIAFVVALASADYANLANGGYNAAYRETDLSRLRP
jgi:hypothetical protein